MEFYQEPQFVGALLVICLALVAGCLLLMHDNKVLTRQLKTPRRIVIGWRDGFYTATYAVNCLTCLGEGRDVTQAVGNLARMYKDALNLEIIMNDEAKQRFLHEKARAS